MEAQVLLLQLGETHGVLVNHAAALSPPKLCGAFFEYGKTTIVQSYVLTDGNFATVVVFAEPASAVTCYVSLSQLARSSEPLGLIDVGWLHESSMDTFLQRSYVDCRYSTARMGAGDDATASSGYLVVYWKGIAEADRAEITKMAEHSAAEVFADAKEGGRSFLRFASEDAAFEFQSAIVRRWSSLRRSVSYSDATDFKLAKGGV